MGRAVPTLGELRERVAVQRRTNTRDSIGGLVESWATLSTVWASVAPKSAGEQYRREQIQASADWTVTVRYDTRFLPTDRISWRGRTFQIVAVENPDLVRRFMQLSCKELQFSATVVSSGVNTAAISTYPYLGF